MEEFTSIRIKINGWRKLRKYFPLLHLTEGRENVNTVDMWIQSTCEYSWHQEEEQQLTAYKILRDTLAITICKTIMKDDRQLINWVQWGIKGYRDRTCICWTRKGSDLYRRPAHQALGWPSQKKHRRLSNKESILFSYKRSSFIILHYVKLYFFCELFFSIPH
jgi:hypothetical protein